MSYPDSPKTERNSENKELLSTTLLAQDVIRICTWVLVTLLSMRGLFAFYGANIKSNFEQFIRFVTDPFVVPYQNILGGNKTPETPVFIALMSILFAGILAYMIIGLLPKFYEFKTRVAHRNQHTSSSA